MFTVLKLRFEKPKLKNVIYRDYKHFSNERLRLDFLIETEKYCLFNDFHSAFTGQTRSISSISSILDKHAL